MRTRLLLAVLVVSTFPPLLHAQMGSGGSAVPHAHSDTNMIFQSARPLVETLQVEEFRDAWGLDILFSNFGFGMGMFYRHQYSNDIFAFATFGISGAKNPDEITLYDPYSGTLLTPAGKINSIYMIPVSFGIQYRLFSDAIAESFRPYVNAGVGPTILLAAPDSLEFFSGIAHSAVHIAPDFFVGLGANIGRDKRTVSGVNFRYYVIPYKRGIESIQGKPITDFGGFFITLNWGIAW